MQKIKWGILGCGRISDWFSQALRTCEGAVLEACASRDVEKARMFAQRFGYKRHYGSYEEMIADKDVDVVYIGTPVRYHFENVKMCIEAGKAVLCEKSFTVNAAEAAELDRLSQKNGTFLMEAMWTKCIPAFKEILKWARGGEFGDIKGAEIVFFNKCLPDHRLYREDIAGGALLDLGVYPITCADAIIGSPVKNISSSALITDNNVDELDTINIEFENGAFASLGCGLLSHPLRQLMYIHGTEGRLLIENKPFQSPEYAVLLDRNGKIKREISAPFRVNGYEYEAEEVMQCLRCGDKRSAVVPMEDTVRVMKIMDECRRQWGHKFTFES